MMSLLDQALKLSRDLDVPVFSLVPGKKTPIYFEGIAPGHGGFHLATRDEAQIRAWWTENPTANIGIPTGSASGLAVLDVDPDKGGNESLKALLLDNYIPKTPTTITPRSGEHIYMQHRDGVRNSTSKVGDGLDIRGEGGYIVAAGSVVDGVEYEWVVYPTHPFAPFPDWLYDLAVKPEPPKHLTTTDGFVQEGSRNTYLVRLAGSMRKTGFDAEAIRVALLVQNNSVCVPPLPDEEIYSIAAQADGWPQGEIEEDENPIESAYTRMNFLRPDDWIHEPVEEDEWVVEDIVPVGLTMVTAFAKGGKSTLTRDMSISVTRGEPFLGKKVKQGKVLYLAVEEFHKKVKQSFKLLGLTANDDLLLKFGKPHKGAVEDLRLICEKEKPVLVVIDTVTRMPKKSFELNDYFANSEWLDPYMYMAHELEIAVIVNYHSSRNGRNLEGIDAIASPLGSTGILATPDQIINVRVESDGTRSLSSVGRYDPFPPTLLGFDKETKRLTALGTKAEIGHQRLRKDIVDALMSIDPATPIKLTTTELMAEVSGNREEKGKALKELLDEGRVIRSGEGKSGSPNVYELADSPFPISTLGTEPRIDLDEEVMEFPEEAMIP